MSQPFSSLLSQLQSLVPAQAGTPSAEHYTQALRQAVATLSRDLPIPSTLTLSVVSGQASYALPADFQRLTRLAPLPQEAFVTGAGLIPVPASRPRERVTVSGLTLTIAPMPGYTLSRLLSYEARHVLGDDDTYAAMTEELADICLLQARALALMVKADKAAGQATSKGVDSLRLDKTRLATALREQAQGLSALYQQRVAQLKTARSTVIVRG